MFLIEDELSSIWMVFNGFIFLISRFYWTTTKRDGLLLSWETDLEEDIYCHRQRSSVFLLDTALPFASLLMCRHFRAWLPSSWISLLLVDRIIDGIKQKAKTDSSGCHWVTFLFVIYNRIDIRLFLGWSCWVFRLLRLFLRSSSLDRHRRHQVDLHHRSMSFLWAPAVVLTRAIFPRIYWRPWMTPNRIRHSLLSTEERFDTESSQ